MTSNRRREQTSFSGGNSGHSLLLWSLVPPLLLLLLLLGPTLARRHPCQPLQNKLQCDNTNQTPFSFLWKIRRDPPAYFFGTIHVPYTKVWDSVPARAKSAFRGAQRVVFELDLLNEATYESLSKCQYLPPGLKLVDVIPKDLFHRLKRHLEWVRFQIPLWLTEGQRARGMLADQLYTLRTANWERKRPIWAMLMINALTESDVRSHGVPVLDSYLAHEAIRLDKRIGSVEFVEEQCAPLNALNSTQVLFALNQTLLQHEAIRLGTTRPQVTTDELIRHYNCGNLDEVVFNHEASQLPMMKNNQTRFLREEEIEMSRKIDEYFKSELIVARNRRMSDRILALLDTNHNETLFFVFGAGHFIGRNSIIDFMLDAGHEITQIATLAPRQLQQRPFTSPRCQQYLKHRNRKLSASSGTTATTTTTSTTSAPAVLAPMNSESFVYDELPPLSAETINTGKNLLPGQRLASPFPHPPLNFNNLPHHHSRAHPHHHSQQQQQQQPDYSLSGQHHSRIHHQSTVLTNAHNPSSSSPTASLSSIATPSSPSTPSRHYFVFNQLYVRTYLDEQNYTDIVLNKWPYLPEGRSPTHPRQQHPL